MGKAILLTGYVTPDLDGVACAIAYEEYLTQKGKNVQVAFFGKPQKEAQFVLDTFSIPQPLNAEQLLREDMNVILLDASDVSGIAKEIRPEQVIEVIDHRKINEVEKFPNAKIHIELVGSCATLIAEKFAKDTIAISENAAALLYSAIVSNTVNFLAGVTTDRDREMSAWLSEQITLPTNYIHAMFAAKSEFSKPLKEVFEDVFAVFTFNEKKLGIVQLEIIDGEKFVNNNRDAIQKALTSLQKEHLLDFIFLTVIDVEKGGNTFYTIDDLTSQLLEKGLLVTFMGNIAKRPGVIMRKTMTPRLKDVLEKGLV